MPDVTSSGVRVRYRVEGTGTPLVLVHGYRASARTQWVYSGWVAFLRERHRILLVDVRGHGESEKPRDPRQYSLRLMASDVIAAMDAAAFERADLMGYSMGAMITMELLLEHGQRFDRAVLGGMGAEWPREGASECRDEEEGVVPRDWPISWTMAKSWAYYARHYDVHALRAVAKHTFANGPVDPRRLGEIEHPVLAVVGTRDRFCAGTRLLADRIPQCQRVTIPGRGHITAVRDQRSKDAVARFFAETPSRFS